AGACVMPQVPPTHERCWHSVSMPAQSVALVHIAPPPLPPLPLLLLLLVAPPPPQLAKPTHSVRSRARAQTGLFMGISSTSSRIRAPSGAGRAVAPELS